ncbi:tryptophan halogenase family protein [Cellvibrio polysaccharolyticus]|uniref:Tryptophan 7-halogenase n=1 Tax=Cellvibrio polysaccharolyticus TaxID=2082724 RepID=A0A928YS76_9GAMM|nr:tryptophan halogenase family protein [Cellvibrio polysaccharolyticus]MBE8716126.1 tryptophan 7-halogenase [Cellvibrio polysaccharolyticus]
MTAKGITRVVIVGGGTAGWMAAAALSKFLGKTLDISLIESDDIGTVGVGEATVPPLIDFHRLLGINEPDFMAVTQATIKLGISFENWKEQGDKYIHAFGNTGKDHWAAGFWHCWLKGLRTGVSDNYGDYNVEHLAARAGKFAILPKSRDGYNYQVNYAYHFDAALYAKFLRKLAENNNVTRIEGKITGVVTGTDNGFIESVTLASGQIIAGELFIDCSGFRGLLIEQTLHTGYEDWSHWLPCDSAVAVQTTLVKSPVPYTRAIARDFGWQWRIPLQHREGTGLVYCSRYLSDEDAKKTLLRNVDGEPFFEPRVIKFRPGQRLKHWNKNCVALGLASGFIEPLESTSIHLIQQGILRLVRLFPSGGVRQSDIDTFNAQTKIETDNVRDFIILHYHATQRTDTPFWRYCRNMTVPDSLAKKLELFRQSGKIFRVPGEFFGENSWVQVLLGQGVVPQHYHQIVDIMSDDELAEFLSSVKLSAQRLVEQLPSHQDFLERYCKAKPER